LLLALGHVWLLEVPGQLYLAVIVSACFTSLSENLLSFLLLRRERQARSRASCVVVVRNYRRRQEIAVVHIIEQSLRSHAKEINVALSLPALLGVDLALATLALLWPLCLCKLHWIELQERALILVRGMLGQDLLSLSGVVLFEQKLLKIVIV